MQFTIQNGQHNTKLGIKIGIPSWVSKTMTKFKVKSIKQQVNTSSETPVNKKLLFIREIIYNTSNKIKVQIDSAKKSK